MSRVVRKRIAARQDLVDVFYHYVGKGTRKTARRFLAQVESTLERLSKLPSSGTRFQPDDPRLAEVRYMPVSRFRMYLIFYLPVADGIDVLRVLHGARDLEGIFASEDV